MWGEGFARVFRSEGAAGGPRGGDAERAAEGPTSWSTELGGLPRIPEVGAPGKGTAGGPEIEVLGDKIPGREGEGMGRALGSFP